MNIDTNIYIGTSTDTETYIHTDPNRHTRMEGQMDRQRERDTNEHSKTHTD